VKIADDITALIGGTPLVRLRGISERTGATVVGKLESFNPGGSVKDRIGLAMIDDALGLVDGQGIWVAPFVMAAINTKNVHRSNALRGHPWGRDFVYDERMLTGSGAGGERRAKALARSTRLQNAVLGFGPARELLRRVALPKPGQGPGQRERDSGRYELLFIGDTAQGRRLRAVVRGDRDPGYGSTAKMLAESAVCLAQDALPAKGGCWTRR